MRLHIRTHPGLLTAFTTGEVATPHLNINSHKDVLLLGAESDLSIDPMLSRQEGGQPWASPHLGVGAHPCGRGGILWGWLWHGMEVHCAVPCAQDYDLGLILGGRRKSEGRIESRATQNRVIISWTLLAGPCHPGRHWQRETGYGKSDAERKRPRLWWWEWS